MADSGLVPDPDTMVAGFEHELGELERTKPRRTAAPRSA
jgi:hypothetical protein